MNESNLIGIAVGLIGSLGGFIMLVASISRAHTRAQDHKEAELKEIRQSLASIEKISHHLEDILNHPDETMFSVKKVREAQNRIEAALAKIQETVNGMADK